MSKWEASRGHWVSSPRDWIGMTARPQGFTLPGLEPGSWPGDGSGPVCPALFLQSSSELVFGCLQTAFTFGSEDHVLLLLMAWCQHCLLAGHMLLSSVLAGGQPCPLSGPGRVLSRSLVLFLFPVLPSPLVGSCPCASEGVPSTGVPLPPSSAGCVPLPCGHPSWARGCADVTWHWGQAHGGLPPAHQLLAWCEKRRQALLWSQEPSDTMLVPPGRGSAHRGALHHHVAPLLQAVLWCRVGCRAGGPALHLLPLREAHAQEQGRGGGLQLGKAGAGSWDPCPGASPRPRSPLTPSFLSSQSLRTRSSFAGPVGRRPPCTSWWSMPWSSS